MVISRELAVSCLPEARPAEVDLTRYEEFRAASQDHRPIGETGADQLTGGSTPNLGDRTVDASELGAPDLARWSSLLRRISVLLTPCGGQGMACALIGSVARAERGSHLDLDLVLIGPDRWAPHQRANLIAALRPAGDRE